MPLEFFIGILGLLILPFLAWLISKDRGHVMWKTVVSGLLMQLMLGVVVISPPGQAFFGFLNEVIVGLLEFTNEGSRFLFGNLLDREFVGQNFAFAVLPTIIFFSSIMGMLYYSGIMQKIVEFIAWVMMKILDTSGAETLSISANIFVGQTEAPLVVKPFVGEMTKSELNTIMTGGFATVAGGVMAAYVNLMKDQFPGIAGHLVTASVMSAPAAIVMSKLTYPEAGDPKTKGSVQVETGGRHQNLVDAAAQGAKTGLKLALNVACMLLAFLALVKGAGNFIVGWFGDQIRFIVIDAGPLWGFGAGAITGYIASVFLVARVLWQEEETKEWIALIALQLLGMCIGATAGYIVGDRLAVWRGAIFGFFVGGAFPFPLFSEKMGKIARSYGFLLSGTVLAGMITYLGAGTSSHAYSAFIGMGFLAFCSAIPYYWFRPSINRAVIVTMIVVISGVLAAGIVLLQNVMFLEILKKMTLQKLIGYAFSLLAVVMGVPLEDVVNFGQLIGTKMALNEFVAFADYKSMISEGMLEPRSILIASYALTGFSNFSSIAIQIGGIGGLAPDRESELASLGPRAMLAGTLASYQTATVAGIMYGFSNYMGIDIMTLGT